MAEPAAWQPIHVLVHDNRGWTETERAAPAGQPPRGVARDELPGFDELGASIIIDSGLGIDGCLMCFELRRPFSDYQQYRLTKSLEREAVTAPRPDV